MSGDSIIPLARPVLGQRERELIDEVLESRYLSLGPMLLRFEAAFAEWLGVEDAVGVSSGTAGLHLCARAVGWGSGDRVLTTPLSFIASSNALLYEGAEPHFCDVDPATLNMDPAAVDAAADGAAGMLAVHIFGYPAALPELQAIADRRGVPIVEDACQSPGAIDAAGAPVGTIGNIASFAFYPNKQMTTGEGGMLIPPPGTDLGARFRSERNQGRSADMEVLEFDRLGFNYRLSDVAAAIGVAQLERLPVMLSQRNSLAAAYRERLEAAGAVEPGGPDDTGLLLPIADRGEERRSWFVYIVQLPEDVDRDRLIDHLTGAGIQTKPYLPCIHTMPFYRERFGFRGGEFPIAERFSARALSLPFFPEMSEAQLDRVCNALLEGLRDQGTDGIDGGKA